MKGTARRARSERHGEPTADHSAQLSSSLKLLEVRHRNPTRRSPRLHLTVHRVPCDGLDPAHEGIRIAHLTDLHLRRMPAPRRLEQAVELVNHHKPDLLLLTGDYVCSGLKALPHLTRALARLEVPAVATLGNHDHWAGAEEVEGALLAAGIPVLSNEHLTFRLRGAPLHLVGIDDPRTGHDDPDLAFSAVPEEGTRVVLAHDPLGAHKLAGRGAALILSGHTHGGQIRIPGVTHRVAKRIGMHYLAGFYLVGESLLYVNRGLGASVPLRIGVPSELALFHLTAVGSTIPASR